MIIVMGLGINGSAEQSPSLLARPPRPSCQQHWASKQCAAPGPLTPWLCACLLLSHLLAPSDAQPSQLSAADVCTAFLACASMEFLAVDALMCALAPFACTCVCVHASSACVHSYACFPLHACMHTQVDVFFSMHAHRCMVFLGMAAHFPSMHTAFSILGIDTYAHMFIPSCGHAHTHALPSLSCMHTHVLHLAWLHTCMYFPCMHAQHFPGHVQTHFQAQICTPARFSLHTHTHTHMHTEHPLPCQVPRARRQDPGPRAGTALWAADTEPHAANRHADRLRYGLPGIPALCAP